ncbi:hypothetical protein BD769DRAFT_1630314 [Suillus cothurnatus]|nr:hypothetical protein BD769DRAFT_1630314 [Suillus cothurnatus]
MANEQYISKKTVAASYRPRSSLMSPGLQRARAPFRLQNAITGLILAGFGVGVWAYSISAVKQDDFSDVDEEARALMRVGPTTVEEVKVPVMDEAKVVATQTPSSVSVEVKAATVPSIHREAFSSLLDPSRKTLIWGAPPVDNIGRLRDSV